MCVDLIIDLAKEEMPCDFRYLPDQNIWSPAIVTSYEFYISNDNAEWKLVDPGEFSNIKNNPLWQVKRFTSKKPAISNLEL